MTRRLPNDRRAAEQRDGWRATARNAARALRRANRIVVRWLFGTLVPVTIAAVAAVLLAASIGPLSTLRPASTLGIQATTVETTDRRVPARSIEASASGKHIRPTPSDAGGLASRDDAWRPDQSATGTRPDHAH